MNYNLDKAINVPYYTNNNDQLFSWYTSYKDGAIINELNKYSNVNFNFIPKTDIDNFGLFGLGFHLNCDFNSGELSIYYNDNNKKILFSVTPTLEENKLLVYNKYNSPYKISSMSPFTFKHFVLETDFKDIKKDKGFIDKYYAGYTSLIQLNQDINIVFKMYFSLHIFDKPSSIAIIYKFFPYKNTKYPNKIYRFGLTESLNTIYDGKENLKTDYKSRLLNFKDIKDGYKGKIVFSYK